MPVSTRYSDTTPQAMKVFIELQRLMPAAKKLETAIETSKVVMSLAATGVRQRCPHSSEREVFLRTAALHLPRDLMIHAYGWHPDFGTQP